MGCVYIYDPNIPVFPRFAPRLRQALDTALSHLIVGLGVTQGVFCDITYGLLS